MDLRHAGAARCDTDRVPTGIAGLGVYYWLMIGIRRGVVVAFDRGRMLVVVCGGPMVVIRMIVVDIVMDVQRRGQRR